jgi:hypothetical protein
MMLKYSIFQLAYNVKVAWKLFLTASSVDISSSFSSFHVFICLASSFLVMTFATFSPVP